MQDPAPKNLSPLRPLVHSAQRTQYQFPVYRFINWIAIGSYLLGLVAMYFLLGMFGIPAPLGWAAIVIMLAFGILLLDHPKLLLQAMMFYFLLMPSNRLAGLIPLPLPGFLDELFFVPLVAVIVMQWINGRQLRGGLWFLFGFLGLSALSWYVNGKPSIPVTIVVVFVLLKPFILWYYCRLCFPGQPAKSIWSIAELYIYFAAAQLLYNCLWHRSLWLRYHPDTSGGVFGPDAFAAHFVGYISVFALFLLAGWWLGVGHRASKPKRIFMSIMGIMILYDLVFMTDTKHVLIFAPIAFSPLFFHKMFSARVRFFFLLAISAFILAAGTWFFMLFGRIDFRSYGQKFVDSPKGDFYRAVTTDFTYLVPYPLLGAGPGRFGSAQAIDTKPPLARRYIIPYVDELHRSMLSHGATGARTGGSILATPSSTTLAITSEFGWAGFILFYAFYFWIGVILWRRSCDQRYDHESRALMLSLVPFIILLVMVMCVTSVHVAPMLMFPFWIIIGLVWGIKPQPLPTDSDDDSLAHTALSFPPEAR